MTPQLFSLGVHPIADVPADGLTSPRRLKRHLPRMGTWILALSRAFRKQSKGPATVAEIRGLGCKCRDGHVQDLTSVNARSSAD
jgi:hypothetical protein